MICAEGTPRIWLTLVGGAPSRVMAVCHCRICAGAPLHEILNAGEWSSPAFPKYLDLHKLETDLVVQSVLEESDAEADTA